jgi:hypothetical protein
MATAERCQVCNKRFWVERRPKESGPSCGGALRETEERRRETMAGFATQKECRATMNKLLVAVDQQNYSAPIFGRPRPCLRCNDCSSHRHS